MTIVSSIVLTSAKSDPQMPILTWPAEGCGVVGLRYRENGRLECVRLSIQAGQDNAEWVLTELPEEMPVVAQRLVAAESAAFLLGRSLRRYDPTDFSTDMWDALGQLVPAIREDNDGGYSSLEQFLGEDKEEGE